MPDTLTGWGVRDPEGRLLPEMPQVEEWNALYLAARRLHARLIDWGCDEGRSTGSYFMRQELRRDQFRDRLLALGYRVVRVELREVPS